MRLSDLSLAELQQRRAEIIEHLSELGKQKQDDNVRVATQGFEVEFNDTCRAISEREGRDKKESQEAWRAFEHGEGVVGSDATKKVSRALDTGQSYRAYLEQRGMIRPSGYELNSAEYKNLSMGNFLRSVLVGPRSETEKRALGESALDTGGYTVPLITAANWIDTLRAETTTFQAGAQLVPVESAQTTIAQLVSDVQFEVVAENNLIPDDVDPIFGGLILTPKKSAAIVRVSIELSDDSTNLDQMLEASFLRAARVELERLGFNGSPLASPPEPTGILNTNGVVEIPSLGFPTSYDGILDAITTLALANVTPNMVVMNPAISAIYSKLKTATEYLPLPKPEAVAQIPFWKQTTGMPNYTILVGDFKDLVYAIRTDIQIMRLNERYAEYGQRGFLGFMRVDVGLAHVQSFLKMTGVTLS